MPDGMRVLVVDDEEELVSTLVERLEIRGISAVGALTAEEAVRQVQARRFDVVVLDVKMPGVSGVEIMRRIKGLDPSLPVLLLTGHMSKEECDRGMQAGAIDYLIKPINLEDLIVKMTEAVTGAARTK